MKLGGKLRLTPTFGGQKDDSYMQSAEVIYIHPKGRFYCVRFENGIRECFPAKREPPAGGGTPADGRQYHGAVFGRRVPAGLPDNLSTIAEIMQGG